MDIRLASTHHHEDARTARTGAGCPGCGPLLTPLEQKRIIRVMSAESDRAKLHWSLRYVDENGDVTGRDTNIRCHAVDIMLI